MCLIDDGTCVAAVPERSDDPAGGLFQVPAGRTGGLSNELSAGRSSDRFGVARKRREAHRPESGVPTSVHHPSIRKAHLMTMIGIDPHKQSHTAVAIVDHEVVVDEFKLRASSVLADRLREWAARFGSREWALESANGSATSSLSNPSLPVRRCSMLRRCLRRGSGVTVAPASNTPWNAIAHSRPFPAIKAPLRPTPTPRSDSPPASRRT